MKREVTKAVSWASLFTAVLIIMIIVGQSAVLMSGKAGEAAFVDIRSIGGLNGDTNRNLSTLSVNAPGAHRNEQK